MTNSMSRLLLSLFLAACLTACATTSPVQPASLIDIDNADIVILGEIHDNPEHHKIQADIIEKLSPAAVVFEMVPQDKTDMANTAIRDGRSLRQALEWDESGWPAWEIYAPVFEAAKSAKIIGAGVPRPIISAAMERGAANVSGLPNSYGLERDLPQAEYAELTRAFIDSHCDMIPESVASKMIEAQRLRDAVFADVTIAAARRDGLTVLITGNGHARRDRGVPKYIARVAPELNVSVVGIVEGNEAEQDLYNYIFETNPAKREDPCAAFGSSDP